MEKVKLGKIVSSVEALKTFTSLKLEKVPVKTKYWMSRLINKIDSELKSYEEVRVGLIKEFGKEKLDEEGKPEGFEIDMKDKEKSEAFYKKFSELQDQEIELEFTKIKIEELEGSEGVTIQLLMQLDWLVQE
jgi:hypothetical protein